MCGSRHERKSFYLLVALVLSWNLHLNTSSSCLFFVLCWSHPLCCCHPSSLGNKEACVCERHHSSCPPLSQRSCKTPSHLTFTGLCNLKALQNTLAPWDGIGGSMKCSCLRSRLNSHTVECSHQSAIAWIMCNSQRMVQTSCLHTASHPPPGYNDSCMALYY